MIRWTNDTFVSEVPVVTAILIVMGGMAPITHLIGIHTLNIHRLWPADLTAVIILGDVAGFAASRVALPRIMP